MTGYTLKAGDAYRKVAGGWDTVVVPASEVGNVDDIGTEHIDGSYCVAFMGRSGGIYAQVATLAQDGPLPEHTEGSPEEVVRRIHGEGLTMPRSKWRGGPYGGWPPACQGCRHLSPYLVGESPDALDTGKAACAAFPRGIPYEMGRDTEGHRQPVPGDHGIQYEAEPEAEWRRRIYGEGEP